MSWVDGDRLEGGLLGWRRSWGISLLRLGIRRGRRMGLVLGWVVREGLLLCIYRNCLFLEYNFDICRKAGVLHANRPCTNAHPSSIYILSQRKNKLQLEFRPLLLHLPLPLPLLPTASLNPPINPPQLQRKPRSQFLQPRSNPLHPLHQLPIRPHHILLRLPFLAENVPMPSQEDVIALIVQRHDLAALQFR